MKNTPTITRESLTVSFSPISSKGMFGCCKKRNAQCPSITVIFDKNDATKSLGSEWKECSKKMIVQLEKFLPFFAKFFDKRAQYIYSVKISNLSYAINCKSIAENFPNAKSVTIDSSNIDTSSLHELASIQTLTRLNFKNMHNISTQAIVDLQKRFKHLTIYASGSFSEQ